ncbi:TPA: ATP-binding protein [Candidatus Latescibacteria bacterium]|nr:ATP-binding protein [Candidatus Latescibacterota bacterium]
MLLTTTNLTKSYHTLEILKGISLYVDRSDSVAITGPSGSGKSTLLHILGTLDTPTSGSLEIDGQDLSTLSESGLSRFRNETVGVVFQDAHLLPQFSVLENVLLPVRAFGRVDAAATEQAESLIASVGLAERMTHLPGQLSGGERQRTAIARSLIMEPSLLLCDEPTGNLDGQIADTVLEVLLSSAVSEDRALIVITHSESLAASMSRRFTLKDGLCSEV